MAPYFSQRKRRSKEDEAGGELNIVPYLDVLMNLIIFMLLSMTGLAAFGALNVNAPNYARADAAPANEIPASKLLLTVLISQKGFFVATEGGVQGEVQPPAAPNGAEPTLPKKPDGRYDFEGLTERMVQIKHQFPQESRVIVGAEADIPYDALIHTMDAIRESPGKDRTILFSDVTLAAM